MTGSRGQRSELLSQRAAEVYVQAVDKTGVLRGLLIAKQSRVCGSNSSLSATTLTKSRNPDGLCRHGGSSRCFLIPLDVDAQSLQSEETRMSMICIES